MPDRVCQVVDCDLLAVEFDFVVLAHSQKRVNCKGLRNQLVVVIPKLKRPYSGNKFLGVIEGIAGEARNDSVLDRFSFRDGILCFNLTFNVLDRRVFNYLLQINIVATKEINIVATKDSCNLESKIKDSPKRRWNSIGLFYEAYLVRAALFSCQSPWIGSDNH